MSDTNIHDGEPEGEEGEDIFLLPESEEAWTLRCQAELEERIQDLPYRLVRDPYSDVVHVPYEYPGEVGTWGVGQDGSCWIRPMHCGVEGSPVRIEWLGSPAHRQAGKQALELLASSEWREEGYREQLVDAMVDIDVAMG